MSRELTLKKPNRTRWLNSRRPRTMLTRHRTLGFDPMLCEGLFCTRSTDAGCNGPTLAVALAIKVLLHGIEP